MSKKSELKRSRKKQQRNRWMSVLLGLGGLVLLVIAALSLNRGGAATAEIEVSGQPSLKVDQEVVDLGDVKINRLVEANFNVTNVGDEPLRFEKEPYVEVVEGC